MRGIVLVLFLLFTTVVSLAQKRVVVNGWVTYNGAPVVGAKAYTTVDTAGIITNGAGKFSLTISQKKPLNIIVQAAGFATNVQPIASNNTADTLWLHFTLQPFSSTLQNVTVKANTNRNEAGLIVIDAEKALVNPSPIMGIESLLKLLVGSNNELTSQYNVRGGSYDENLIYVNDFEIFKPYLVSTGQQEGLSFINPALVSNVKFYNGGFQAKYGDKMSSVLDVTYTKPITTKAGVYLGLLEQGVDISGLTKNKNFSYVFGARNRSNRNLLSSQETVGNYIPSSADVQALLTWKLSNKWQLESFTNISGTSFILFPQESQLTSGVFSPLFASALGLNISFAGQEQSKYRTYFQGVSATQLVSSKLRLKWMASYLQNIEKENMDVEADYIFGERNIDNQSSSFGLITNPLGAGLFHNFTRNNLDISVASIGHKGFLQTGNHAISWGATVERQQVNDALFEWQYNDSAGYSLPFVPGQFRINKFLNSTANFNAARLQAFVQNNQKFSTNKQWLLQYGVRVNYNTLNNQLLISPRGSVSYQPTHWKKDILFKAAVGMYNQPPFYREMRRFDGSVNTGLLAQQSAQVTLGMDQNFKVLNRPARITYEAFYKQMWNVVSYDIDNVRLRYAGENNANAYAFGFETRLYSQLVKDAESWLSIGYLTTKENLKNDFFTTYFNAAGQEITASTPDKVPVDSTQNAVGWLRRPTDRRINFGMFFQDYLPSNKNIRVYMNALYGSNLPYNIPGSTRYRNALTIDPYFRIDIGVTAVLINKEKPRRYSPFRKLETAFVSFEVFNLVDRANIISYQLIKDFANNTYTMPNRLTPRLINIKLVARW